MTDTSSDLIQRYMSQEDAAARISLLKNAKAQGLSLPLPFIREMLRFDLIQLEKALLVSCVEHAQPSLAIEDFLTRHLTEWGQETAAAAIRTWTTLPERVLWHRLAALVHISILPQRLKYTLAETCIYFNPVPTISKLIEHGDLAEYSETYHSLLFRRSLEFSVHHKKLLDLAKGILNQQQDEPFIKNRTLPFAAAYVARYQPEVLEKYYWMFVGSLSWLDMLRPLLRREDTAAINEKAAKACQTVELTYEQLHEAWPQIHFRHLLSPRTLEILIETLLHQDGKLLKEFGLMACQNLLYGCSLDALRRQLLLCKKSADLKNYMKLAEAFLSRPLAEDHDKHLKNHLPAATLENILPAFSATHLRDISHKTAIQEEQNKFLTKTGAIYHKKPSAEDERIEDNEFGTAQESLTLFFNTKNGVACKSPSAESADYYQMLSHAWRQQDSGHLNKLAAEARKSSGINKLLYMETLGRFVNMDEAAQNALY